MDRLDIAQIFVCHDCAQGVEQHLRIVLCVYRNAFPVLVVIDIQVVTVDEQAVCRAEAFRHKLGEINLLFDGDEGLTGQAVCDILDVVEVIVRAPVHLRLEMCVAGDLGVPRVVCTGAHGLEKIFTELEFRKRVGQAALFRVFTDSIGHVLCEGYGPRAVQPPMCGGRRE